MLLFIIHKSKAETVDSNFEDSNFEESNSKADYRRKISTVHQGMTTGFT